VFVGWLVRALVRIRQPAAMAGGRRTGMQQAGAIAST